MPRVKARIQIMQIFKSPDQEPSAGEQQRAQRDLYENEGLPAAPGAARPHAAKNTIEADPRSGDRRNQAEQKHRRDQNREREQQHAPVDAKHGY